MKRLSRIAIILSLVGLAFGQYFPVYQGGTGAGSFTTHCVLIGEGTGPFADVCGSVAGYVLTWNASGDPSFQAVGGTGTVTSVATSSPLTGGPITNTGTVACPSCAIGPGVSTANHLAKFSGTNGLTLADGGAIPSGTVTSVTAGTGLTASPSNPITTSGTLNLSVPVSAANSQAFIDVTAGGSFTIPGANTVLYLDFMPGLLVTPIVISDGTTTGQLLTIACNSEQIGIQAWQVNGDYNAFSNLTLGGATDAGSYDNGTTYVDSSQTSCGAQLMWDDVNGVWQLINIFGGAAS